MASSRVMNHQGRPQRPDPARANPKPNRLYTPRSPPFVGNRV